MPRRARSTRLTQTRAKQAARLARIFHACRSAHHATTPVTMQQNPRNTHPKQMGRPREALAVPHYLSSIPSGVHLGPATTAPPPEACGWFRGLRFRTRHHFRKLGRPGSAPGQAQKRTTLHRSMELWRRSPLFTNWTTETHALSDTLRRPGGSGITNEDFGGGASHCTVVVVNTAGLTREPEWMRPGPDASRRAGKSLPAIGFRERLVTKS
jgi:hypothetical protein